MAATNESLQKPRANQNIQVFVRVRPTNARERLIRSNEIVEVTGVKDVTVKQIHDSRATKKFSFDRAFGMNSQQHEVYQTVVAPLIQEVTDGYNCTVFAYGQTGTGKTYTMVGEEQSLLSSQYDDVSNVGMIPRALSHLFDKLRVDKSEFAMRVSYLELYNEELCDLLSTDDNVKIRLFDDANKKGSVIVQGLEEIPVRCKDDVYKLLAKGQERRKTAATLMNAQSSRSHTVFSILVHIKECGPDGEEMLKIGKLNLVDLAGSENISKAGNEKGIRTRESVNINQSLLTLGRVITALVERAPHVPYRESKLTRLLQESLGGRTKTSIIATISCGHKDLEETLSTLDYAHRAKNIQNKPEINQRLTKKVILKEYTEEIDKLKRDLLAAREKNGIYLPTDSYNDMVYKMENTEKELGEIMAAFTKTKEELNSKMKLFEETKQNLAVTAEQLVMTEGKYKLAESELTKTKRNLRKTERNYTEAKHIIAVQEETEQKLTEQTKEIMKIADEASDDTKSLLENIRRRKEKEENAAKTIDNVMNTITNRLSSMQDEIQQLEGHHKENRDIIVADLNAQMESNAKYTDNFVDSLKEISSTQKSFQNEFYGMFEKWMYSQDGSNADFQSFAAYFKSTKEREEKFFDTVGDKINQILMLLNERKNEETKISNFVLEKLNEQQKLTNDYTNYLQLKLNHYCEELDAVKSSMRTKNTAQKSKINEIEKLLAEIKSYEKDDDILDVKLSDIHDDIKGNGITATKGFIESYQTVTKSSKEFMDDKNCIIDKNHEKLLAEVKGTAEIVKDNDTNLKMTLESQTENIDKFKTAFQDHQNVMQYDLSSKQDDLIKAVREDMLSSKSKLREIKSVVQHNLHLVVQEAENNLLMNIRQTTEDIQEFKNADVCAYVPTGETPARKDYKFNRQINTTSPHDRIIKRLRLEQGLSDSTLQDSSILEEDEVSNFSGKEVYNSTAIMDQTAIDTPQSKMSERLMNVEDQENNPQNI
ncbi:unnamed protein product [Chironomus riparius]|uniref:Kinesin-like protein n=1 Tax=Chironomus riparius TaxID=315576 RepID=A0A9N9RIZ9_9DIPT|nr:unnamed protein product [Chironomus riparius]